MLSLISALMRSLPRRPGTKPRPRSVLTDLTPGGGGSLPRGSQAPGPAMAALDLPSAAGRPRSTTCPVSHGAMVLSMAAAVVMAAVFAARAALLSQFALDSMDCKGGT